MFTAQDVSKLRQTTGAGMMDCKKALTETNGNFDEAIKYLREKGITPFLCHCSGEKAEKECERIGVGDTLFFV